MSETDRPPHTDGEEPFPREFMILLNPDHHINQRVDSQAFLDFATAVLDAIKSTFPAPRRHSVLTSRSPAPPRVTWG